MLLARSTELTFTPSGPLLRPQQKLKRRDYESVDELADDVDLIFSNALVFNMDESQMCVSLVPLRERNLAQLKLSFACSFAVPSTPWRSSRSSTRSSTT